jgi:hypothetical protein
MQVKGDGVKNRVPKVLQRICFLSLLVKKEAAFGAVLVVLLANESFLFDHDEQEHYLPGRRWCPGAPWP